MVAGPVPMGSGQAQPEEVNPHVGPPLAGGAVEVRCSMDSGGSPRWGGLGGPIPGY